MNVATQPFIAAISLIASFEEVRVVGRLQRLVVAAVDLPLRRVVLLVHADEREPERAHAVLHLADHAPAGSTRGSIR